jgi:hypothetical protein
MTFHGRLMKDFAIAYLDDWETPVGLYTVFRVFMGSKVHEKFLVHNTVCAAIHSGGISVFY